MEQYDALQGMPLAMAYVPWQSWQNVFDGARGLEQGSIFEELVFPFEYAGPGCRNTGSCRRGSCPGRQMNRRCPMMQERRRDCSCREMTDRN